MPGPTEQAKNSLGAHVGRNESCDGSFGKVRQGCPPAAVTNLDAAPHVLAGRFRLSQYEQETPMPYLAVLFEEILASDEVPDVTHLLEDDDTAPAEA